MSAPSTDGASVFTGVSPLPPPRRGPLASPAPAPQEDLICTLLTWAGSPRLSEGRGVLAWKGR